MGIVIVRRMYFLRQHCGQNVQPPSFFQPVGVRPSPLAVGLTTRDIEQVAQTIAIGSAGRRVPGTCGDI